VTEEAMTALERELTLLVRRVLRGLWTADHGPDIDHTVFPLLVALRDEGPMRTGELARHFHLDKSTVSRHIARLERPAWSIPGPTPTTAAAPSSTPRPGAASASTRSAPPAGRRCGRCSPAGATPTATSSPTCSAASTSP
jgi:MarR family